MWVKVWHVKLQSFLHLEDDKCLVKCFKDGWFIVLSTVTVGFIFLCWCRGLMPKVKHAQRKAVWFKSCYWSSSAAVSRTPESGQSLYHLITLCVAKDTSIKHYCIIIKYERHNSAGILGSCKSCTFWVVIFNLLFPTIPCNNRARTVTMSGSHGATCHYHWLPFLLCPPTSARPHQAKRPAKWQRPLLAGTRTQLRPINRLSDRLDFWIIGSRKRV